MPSLEEDLDLALRLADRADSISLARFGAADLHVDAKPDLTPVSDADLAVENALREVIGRERPTDRIVGEEFGSSRGADAGRRWVLDPDRRDQELCPGRPGVGDADRPVRR